MYGAIIGDFAGSIYEYPESIDAKNKIVNLERRLSIYNNKLLTEKSFYSDDTILTIAILDSIINNISYEFKLKEYGLNYINHKLTNLPYFKSAFSPKFTQWCQGNYTGTSRGNGSAMRVSPVGHLFNTEEEVINESIKATIPSHNTVEAIESAKAVALTIYLLKKGLEKDYVINYVVNKFNFDINLDIDHLQRTNIFSCSAYKAVNEALYILSISSSFDEAIRHSISIGGDTDTITAITGSMAEVIYPIEKDYIDFVNEKLPSKFVKLIQTKRFYGKL